MTEYRNDTGRHIMLYWIWNMERQFLAYVIALFIFSFYEFFITGSNTLSEGIEKTPFVLLAGGVLILGIYAATAGRNSIPLAVSFGSTRKEAFLGSQITSLLLMLQFLLLFIVLQFFIGGTEIMNSMLASSCTFFAGCMFLILGIGQIFAVIITKMGSRAASIFIVMIIMILVFGLTGAMVTDDLTITSFFGFTWKSAAYALCIGGTAYVLGIVVNARSTKKMTVNI